MGTSFIAAYYGVAKSTLCDALSKALIIPAYSAADLISTVNGEQDGANEAVKIHESVQSNDLIRFVRFRSTKIPV